MGLCRLTLNGDSVFSHESWSFEKSCNRAIDYLAWRCYGATVIQNVQSRCLFYLLGLLLVSEAAHAQSFSDMFAGQQLLTNSSVLVIGSNTNATSEPFEPNHAGKIGGQSVWISWRAPDNGLVTLSTAGSSFDTLLAVYTLEHASSSPLRHLAEAASDDDYAGLKTSYLQFGANSNQLYYIAVDGFNGASGDILLQLNFLSSSNLQPSVVRRPGDQALRLGDPLILTMNLVPSPKVGFRWYLNGSPVAGQDDDSTDPTLIIPSLQRTNLGFYSLKFYLDDDSFFSSAIEIQVNSEGQPNVLARNKIADAAQSGLNLTLTQSGQNTGVMLGYNGTQIFNNTNAIVDTNAPLICGVAPGAAYWFSYRAPTNGIMTVDTGGSSFATLLAVFTYTGVLVSYTNLTFVACDNNNGGTGTNTSWVQFAVTNGGNYFIVVGGVNGARGIAHLNYSLSAGLPAQPPVLTSPPQPLTVSAQTAVALSVVAGGTAPFAYQWWKNNSRLKQQTNANLLLRSPQNADSGNYFVVVTNISGAVTSAPAALIVISAPILNFNAAANSLVAAFPVIRGYQYGVDCAEIPAGSGWWFWTNSFPDYGGVLWLTNATTDHSQLFLRVHTP